MLIGPNVNMCSQEPNRRIVQQWRFKTWPEGQYSIVDLTMTEKEDCTDLVMKQTGIPARLVLTRVEALPVG